MFPSLRRIFAVGGAAVALGLAVGVCFFLKSSLEKGAPYRELLAGARMVTINEYRARTGDGIYRDILTSKTLDHAQAQAFSHAFSGVSLLTRASYCAFEPHHEIVCTMPDGSIHRIHLCFKCEQVAIDSGMPTDMSPWTVAVRRALSTCGVPIRSAEYQYQPKNQT